MTLAEAGVAFVTERPIPGGAGESGQGAGLSKCITWVYK